VAQAGGVTGALPAPSGRAAGGTVTVAGLAVRPAAGCGSGAGSRGSAGGLPMRRL